MTQTAQILAALRAGAATSRSLSDLLRVDRRCISVVLCGLANIGAIERAGVENLGRVGRPYVRWRLTPAPPPDFSQRQFRR